MKTSTLLGRPFLLVALLAVSWAAAAPLQADPENEDLRDELQAFFEQNPSIADKLYPVLVDQASDVTLTVDQDDVLYLLNNYVRKATVEEIEEELEREAESEEEEQEEEHPRRKRQTSFLGNIDASKNPFGESIGGNVGLGHAWDNDRHSLSGTIGGTRHNINGLGSATSYNAGLGYNYSPNEKTSFGINAHKTISPGGSGKSIGVGYNYNIDKDTSFSINANKNMYPGGSNHNIGLSLEHKFGG